MKNPLDPIEFLVSKAGADDGFRERLIARPKETIEREFGVTLAGGAEIHVHQETGIATHIVLPPKSKLSAEERQAAITGAASLEFLKKTMYDPAPGIRPPGPERPSVRKSTDTPDALAGVCRDSISRGLDFLESTIDENGAWHCIRFSTSDGDIPRHFEKPPFVSALCVLALESSGESRARAICRRTREYLVQTIEYPGFWRYYRHLPQDLDSTTLCSLVIGAHPWILLGKNVSRMLANRDEKGRFLTWLLEEDQPDVVARFRIEADPVVNANVIAYLGDHPETRDARQWLETLIAEGSVEGSSKWYPDAVAIYYATSRAIKVVQPALDQLRPLLADRILEMHDEKGGFGNVLQTAQAVSALHNISSLERIDAQDQADRLVRSQREDGSWPELLAFGDQSLKWGVVGQIGHGSESVTTAFCIEALERLVESLES